MSIGVTELANKCAVSRQTADRWLRGEFVPTPEMMIRICRALAVTDGRDLFPLDATDSGVGES